VRNARRSPTSTPTLASASRGARVGRGAVVSVVAVLLAAVSHVASGGPTPGTTGTIMALTFAFLVSIALSGRRLNIVRLSLSVALAQVAFHLMFGIGAAAAGAEPVSASGAHRTVMAGMLGMAGEGGRMLGNASPSTGAADTMDMTTDPRMWLGHALAALITVALLHRGEKTFWNLVALAGAGIDRVALVFALPSSVAIARHRVVAAIAERRGLLDLGILLADLPRRGPPRLA